MIRSLSVPTAVVQGCTGPCIQIDKLKDLFRGRWHKVPLQ